ncbi:MAG: ligase-associated DNA damage response endonuclease PdeM [Chitinophagaceae bacterium]
MHSRKFYLQAPVPHILHQHKFWVSPERVLFWENESTVIVSDLHIGKTGHFRKSGIAMPQAVFKEDMLRLVAQLQHFSPNILLVVGDLFHSVANKELELFEKWRNDFPDLTIKLVKGNHDILKNSWYTNAGITVIHDRTQIKGFCFTHDYESCGNITSDDGEDKTLYTISGHIHPGVKVKGFGKQSLCLPCFYFGKDFAVLPAFSRFTGTALIEPKAGDSVFALVDNRVIKLK